MNKAELYQRVNYMQKRDSKQAVQNNFNRFKWRLDGHDSVLDAGCGSGDITRWLLSILPPNCKRLVGVDISDKMLDYARSTQIHQKLSFEHFNLNLELEMQPFGRTEPFDHIFSFYCLMWIPNQKICLQNFYKLLNPDGDMLLVFVANTPIFDAYKVLSQNNKWSNFMYDVDQLISPYQYSTNPGDEFRNLLNDCDFKKHDVTVHNNSYVFDGIEMMQDFLLAINPFIDRIPEEDQQTFLDELIHQLVLYDCALDDFYTDSKTCRFFIPYVLTVAYAQK